MVFLCGKLFLGWKDLGKWDNYIVLNVIWGEGKVNYFFDIVIIILRKLFKGKNIYFVLLF